MKRHLWCKDDNYTEVTVELKETTVKELPVKTIIYFKITKELDKSYYDESACRKTTNVMVSKLNEKAKIHQAIITCGLNSFNVYFIDYATLALLMGPSSYYI